MLIQKSAFTLLKQDYRINLTTPLQISTSSLAKGFQSTPKGLWKAKWTENPMLAKMRCQIKCKVFNYGFRFVNYNLRNVNYSLQPIILDYQL